MLTGLSGSWATGVGETLNFDNAWVPSAAGNHYGLQHARLDTGDAEKVTYISPKLGGFPSRRHLLAEPHEQRQQRADRHGIRPA